MKPKLWSNVQVAMQSAIATAKTITGITNANPGVVSCVGHGYAAGSYVLLPDVQGMTEVRGRVFRVANPLTDSFELEGEDTTNYGTFTSGTVQLLTLGTSLGTARGISASGGDYPFVDTTTIHDKASSAIPGTPSAINYTMENIWDVTDTALQAMKVASKLKEQRAFKWTFSDGTIMVFNGYVGANLAPVGNAQDLVTTPVVVTMFGEPTYYAA